VPDILVTDDDAELRSFIRAALERAGHSVAEAADGRAALRHLDDNRVDVLITDMHMPDVDGLELSRSLRRVQDAPAIIGMSGNDFAGMLEMATLLGARATLSKPFSIGQLLEAVQTALRPRSDGR
jgi:CheY-like chemotaxis protein